MDPESVENDEFLSGLPQDGDARIIGPVKIQAKISKGGMGIVYRGRHLKLDIDVAVKFLFPHLAEKNPEYVLRFEREARMAARLNNENLVRVFDVDSQKNYHYVVMELVCGETARDRVARKGPLAEPEALEIVLGATRGLDAAHRRGIVHRDIKPDNIMIDSSGIVKLADLGIAKMLNEEEDGGHLTQPGFVMGTPSFMPPEQLMDARSVGLAGDIYSMGATLYFLLMGKAPYLGSMYEIFQKISREDFPDVRKERPAVSERVVEILRRCTRREAAARYPDAGSLLQALEGSGTERKNLADALTGTVTAEAKVSTPPSRKIGEIRLELPPEGEGRAASPRRALKVGRLCLLLAGLLIAAAAGGYFGLEAWKRSQTAPEPRLAEGQQIQDEKGAPKAEAPLADRKPAPEKPDAETAKPATKVENGKGAPGATAVAQVPAKTTPARPVKTTPRAPAKTAAPIAPEKLQAAREKVEDGLRKAKELTDAENPEAALKLIESLRPIAIVSPDLEKLRAESLAVTTRRKERQVLLRRAQELIEIGDEQGAANIFDVVKNWEELQPRAFALRIKALLSARVPAEKAALKLFGESCGTTATFAEGSACYLGYEEILIYARAVPSPRVGAAVWDGKLSFWREVPPPPKESQALIALYDDARTKIMAGYVSFLAESVKSALDAEDAAGARRDLDKAVECLRSEKLLGSSPEQVAMLDASRKDVERLEVELEAWERLLPVRDGAKDVSKLTLEGLREGTRQLGSFLGQYPQGAKAKQAAVLKKLYENELKERDAERKP